MADLSTGSSFVAGDTIVASAMNTRFTTIETWANGTPNIGGSSGATTIDNNLAVTGTVTVTGTSTFNNTLTVGQNDTGHNVKFYGATADKYMEWDESADQLDVTGSLDVTGNTSMVGTLTVGINGTGHDDSASVSS